MLGPELVVALGLAIALTAAVADRIRVAPPVLLLVIGALLAFVPTFARVELPADAVLLLFLPRSLYWESLTTSLREIRKNLRGIVLMGTLLVVVTAGVVATLLHLLGMPWPAWVLGAAVAPTDATAVGVLTKMLPRRNVTVLRAEEPGERRHDARRLRHRGRRDGGHAGADVLERVRHARALLRGRRGGRAARRVARVARAASRRHRRAREHGHAARALRGLPRRRGDRCLRRARRRRRRHRGEPGRAEARPGGDPPAGPRLLVVPDVPAQRRVVRARGHRGDGRRAAARGPRAVDRRRARARRLRRARPRPVRLRGRPRRHRLAGDRRFGGEPREGRRDRLVSGFAGFRGAVSLAMAVAVPRTLESGGASPTATSSCSSPRVSSSSRSSDRRSSCPPCSVTAALPRTSRSARSAATPSGRRSRRRSTRSPARPQGRGRPSRGRAGAEGPRAHLDVIQAREEDDDDHPALQRHDTTVALELALVRHKAATLLRLRDADEIDDLVLRQVRAGYDARRRGSRARRRPESATGRLEVAPPPRAAIRGRCPPARRLESPSTPRVDTHS